MKKLFPATIILLSGLLILASVGVAQAGWPALKSSGYAVTTDWHGTNVPIGESVTAWAGTTDNIVTSVKFKWKDPSDNTAREYTDTTRDQYTTPTVPAGVPEEISDWAAKYPNVIVYYFEDTYAPNVLGDWGVQALFLEPNGNPHGSDTTAIRATSFLAIPEAQFGAIAILLSTIGAIGIFAIKRKHIPKVF